MAARSLVAVSVRRGVQTVRFSDPRKLNAWSLAMQGEISGALARAAADDKVDAVVLSGTGGYYCVSARLRDRDRRWAWRLTPARARTLRATLALAALRAN